MHEAVTNSLTSTNTFPQSPSDDLQTPISIKPRLYTTDTLGWSQTHSNSSEYSVENWPLSTSNNSVHNHLTTGRRTNSAGLQRIPYSSNMPTRTDNNTSERSAPGHRWRFNTNGQLIDSESPNWELADEIVRLNIGDVTGDTDDVHRQLRTPAKSRLAVAQLSEASPLETSSSASVGSSPHASEHEINISHSRGSSTDTTVSSSRESVGSVPNKASLAKPPLKVNTGNEIKERPHSFSGGLSTADLRRLQQAGEAPEVSERQHRAQGQYRENMAASTEQLSYPSIINHIHRPQPQPHPQMYDYRSDTSQLNQASNHDDIQLDYAMHQRNFNLLPQGLPLAGQLPGPTFVQNRPTNMSTAAYRQAPRGYPQGVIPNPPTMGYPAHTSHLSLGNTQQLYDMMLPGPHQEGHHPAVARVQQQHNVFRPTHHHSASDPSATIRDTATLALINNGTIQPFAPGIFQPGMPAMPLYPNQYYAAQEQYQLSDAAVMASRLQPQYSGQYAVMPPQSMIGPEPISSPTSNTSQGPSANNRKLGLYKTELCRSWEEKGSCRYATKCQFAHGEEELRKVSRHPKYKTEICRTFWVSGTCPYGKRCCFIHTELPTSGGLGPTPGGVATPTTDSTAQQRIDGRARSLSTNSDPNDANVSLLARISGKRTQEILPATSADASMFQFTRPPTGSLRVDTSTLDTSVKQNKSAYPSFASNGILLPAPEQISQKSPGPVTAGPDLGRHNNARREIVGYNRTHKPNASSTSSIRPETDINVNSSPSVASSYTLSSGDGNVRPTGHVRAGSAGNWGNFSRNSHLSQSPYPGPSPAGEIIATSPWPSNELVVGSSRMHEKVWA